MQSECYDLLLDGPCVFGSLTYFLTYLDGWLNTHALGRRSFYTCLEEGGFFYIYFGTWLFSLKRS